MSEKLQNIAELSRFYGSDSTYVFLGGGNTSVKEDNFLYIKPSGVALATIQPENFVKIDRTILRKMFEYQAVEQGIVTPEMSEADALPFREAYSKLITEKAICSKGMGRPSVETPLHELIDWTYIVHLHPSLINGMTCANNAKATCEKLFPEALWMDYIDPGFTLSITVKKALDAYKAQKGTQPHAIFLKNHGVFVGADTPEEIRDIYANLISTLTAAYQQAHISTEEVTWNELPAETVEAIAPQLRTLLAPSKDARAIVTAVGDCPAFQGPLTPDHIVYASTFAYTGDGSAESFEQFKAEKGTLPKIVSIQGVGTFAVASTLADTQNAIVALRNALTVEKLTQAFGGTHYMEPKQYGFIEHWEAESYRRKQGSSSASGSLNNRVCVVTGGAQGFGLGIAESLAANGGILVIADMNKKGANDAAKKLNDAYGKNRAFAVSVNVSDEESVQQMVTDIVRLCGGIDLFVSNAGVVRSGSVMELAKQDWDFVTNINYTGYFLCVKHVARIMARQIVNGKGFWSDIVQVNSKSGLDGSNKNGAYAGSKFGGIGLTQSFAKELVEQCIKVNSVCPGNYYEGPLWSDPVKGLFLQYLNSGKVPGAQTVADVRKFYEDKVPMRRGCFPADVAQAIIYCVEQRYETGQAIPVTGGQIMLH